MPNRQYMFVGKKKQQRRYSETISKCLKSRHVYMECMKHTKRKKKRPNSPLCHPVGQQTGPKTERGRRSVEPHSGINCSAGLELIYFTLSLPETNDAN